MCLCIKTNPWRGNSSSPSRDSAAHATIMDTELVANDAGQLVSATRRSACASFELCCPRTSTWTTRSLVVVQRTVVVCTDSATNDCAVVVLFFACFTTPPQAFFSPPSVCGHRSSPYTHINSFPRTGNNVSQPLQIRVEQLFQQLS